MRRPWITRTGIDRAACHSTGNLDGAGRQLTAPVRLVTRDRTGAAAAAFPSALGRARWAVQVLVGLRRRRCVDPNMPGVLQSVIGSHRRPAHFGGPPPSPFDTALSLSAVLSGRSSWAPATPSPGCGPLPGCRRGTSGHVGRPLVKSFDDQVSATATAGAGLRGGDRVLMISIARCSWRSKGVPMTLLSGGRRLRQPGDVRGAGTGLRLPALIHRAHRSPAGTTMTFGLSMD